MSKKQTIKMENMVDVKGITKNQTEVIKEYKKVSVYSYMDQPEQVKLLLHYIMH